MPRVNVSCRNRPLKTISVDLGFSKLPLTEFGDSVMIKPQTPLTLGRKILVHAGLEEIVMPGEFQVGGSVAAAPFTLKLHRGDGMVLLAMDWKGGPPPDDFVGFGIQFREPGSDRLLNVRNRLAFTSRGGDVDPSILATMTSPIQKFRWVHLPFNADMPGNFYYRVTPVFMNERDELSYGIAQEASIELRRETYPGQLNVTFTRGFVSSQAFVDRYASTGPISTLLPARAEDGLTFAPTHPKTAEALTWMGFEARSAIIEVLDEAIADGAEVRVVAYDLSEPDVVTRLEAVGRRLRIIIDDDGTHGEHSSGETQAEARLVASAGRANVRRHHMGQLQHNKVIVVDGPTKKRVVCGSTNFSWRGFFVQANNAVILTGPSSVATFLSAFDAYWASDAVSDFGRTPSAHWSDLGLVGIDAKVAFSPHNAGNALLDTIADDIRAGTTSCLLYSLAFLYQTPGAVRDAITAVTTAGGAFVYGISDKRVGGLEILKPDGNRAPVRPAALEKDAPLPFKAEPKGGGGNRMHHKFVVIDFDKPSARVYLGSYNFSVPADRRNGENLLLVRDRRVATSYAVEALRIFDHYHFRVAQQEAKQARRRLALKRPPRAAGEAPWFAEDYATPSKAHDRELFR